MAYVAKVECPAKQEDIMYSQIHECEVGARKARTRVPINKVSFSCCSFCGRKSGVSLPPDAWNQQNYTQGPTAIDTSALSTKGNRQKLSVKLIVDLLARVN